MKRIAVASLAFIGCMTLFALAGCGGDFASPTTTDYQATTTTTTTTTTAAAEMTQTHNRSVCVGFFNIGSCNTVQVSTQSVNRPAGAPAPVQTSGSPTGAQTVGALVLLCLGFVFVIGVAGAVMGNGGYN